MLDTTPFYAEMGGQVGDRGTLVNENETVEIIDTRHENNLSIHITKKLPVHPEAEFMACVDIEARHGSEANHTATHLLDQALREVLGTHVEQKGSLVTPQYLRFDFSHFQKVTPEELRQVERIVNARIREDIPLTDHRDMPLDKARELAPSRCSARNTATTCAWCSLARALSSAADATQEHWPSGSVPYPFRG